MLIHRLFRIGSLLATIALIGCSSSLVPSSGQGGSGGAAATGGVPGSGGINTRAQGGSGGGGGTPQDGGAAPRSCGTTVCTSGEYCCDSLCSKCAPIGALCTQGCQIGDAGFGAGVCAGLKEQYLQAIRTAQACSVGPAAQCGAMAHAWLPADPCGCDMIFVNDSTQPDAIYQTWLSAGCQPDSTCMVNCGASPGGSGVCIPTDGGVSGVCQYAAPHGG